MNIFKKIFVYFVSIFFVSICLAKQINFYDQPSQTAAVTGQIDLATGYIPFFESKDGAWVKVADPKNGNVGWLKQADLQANMHPNVTMSQQIITHDGKNYQIITNGKVKQLTAEEAAPMIKKMEVEQRQLHARMQHSMESMFADMDQMFHHQWHAMHAPYIVPMIVVPHVAQHQPKKISDKVLKIEPGKTQDNNTVKKNS